MQGNDRSPGWFRFGKVQSRSFGGHLLPRDGYGYFIKNAGRAAQLLPCV